MCSDAVVNIFSLCGVFNTNDGYSKQIKSIFNLFDKLMAIKVSAFYLRLRQITSNPPL